MRRVSPFVAGGQPIYRLSLVPSTSSSHLSFSLICLLSLDFSFLIVYLIVSTFPIIYTSTSHGVLERNPNHRPQSRCNPRASFVRPRCLRAPVKVPRPRQRRQRRRRKNKSWASPKPKKRPKNNQEHPAAASANSNSMNRLPGAWVGPRSPLRICCSGCRRSRRS